MYRRIINDGGKRKHEALTKQKKENTNRTDQHLRAEFNEQNHTDQLK